MGVTSGSSRPAQGQVLLPPHPSSCGSKTPLSPPATSPTRRGPALGGHCTEPKPQSMDVAKPVSPCFSAPK